MLVGGILQLVVLWILFIMDAGFLMEDREESVDVVNERQEGNGRRHYKCRVTVVEGVEKRQHNTMEDEETLRRVIRRREMEVMTRNFT